MKLLFLLMCLSLSQAQTIFGVDLGKAANSVKDAAGSAISTSGDFISTKFTELGSTLGKAKDTVVDFIDDKWSDFKNTVKKSYTVAEEKLRKDIFAANYNRLKKLIDDIGFEQKLNDFADLVADEFNSQFNGFGKKETQDDVLPAKTTQVLWKVNSLGKGVLRNISMQNIIDCSRRHGNSGCYGGLMTQAYQYVKDNSGINSEKVYPYNAKDLSCRFKSNKKAASISGYVAIPSGDEKALKQAVATKGPISAAIHVNATLFQFYSDGIYVDPKCKSNVASLNHAVLIVGYGSESRKKKYWLVKNSYGTNWGINGYFKITRNKNNHCGIATSASYPILN